MTTLFCVKRLVYALITVYLFNNVVPQLYAYIFVPLFSIGFNIRHKPFNSKLLHYKENLNEFAILMCAYYIAMFTQWICDPMVRYQIGWIFIQSLFVILLINLMIIIYQISNELHKQHKKKKW